MNRHRCPGNGPRSWRLILAALSEDHDAAERVHAEHAGSADCLYDTIDRLAEIAAAALFSRRAPGAATEIAEAETALAIEGAERPRERPTEGRAYDRPTSGPFYPDTRYGLCRL